MKKRIITIMTALAVLCSSIIPGMEIKADTAAANTTGVTYYVSTLHGKDSNNGTSQSTPFYSLQKINNLKLNPGDKVLLECDSVFTDGYLHLYEQKGSKDAPIIIDQYGKGAMPVIDTNGQGVWYQNYGNVLDNPNHVYHGYVSSSILLYDTEYIEINNLEIVNDAVDIEAVYNEAEVMNRTGVAAVAQNKGTMNHIYLKGLNVHDVYGNVYDKHMNNGGIYFTVFLPKDAVEQNGEYVSASGIPRYNDILIENCTVRKTNRWGIAVGYTAYWNKFADMAIADETVRKYGSTNVVIRNNYVKDSGGDAITTMYCDRPLIEYNVSDGAAAQINNLEYVNQVITHYDPVNKETKEQDRKGEVAAAIWPWKCKDAVFQYNEAFDTRNGDKGNDDGQAWDADSGDGTLYQYNYSHDNSGGCVMFCLDQAYQNTFRYNISQNDLKGAMDITNNPDAHVYNNVFYMKEGIPFIRQRENGGNLTAENNIIYYAGDSPKEETWTKTNKKPNQKLNVVYSNNLYYNYTSVPESDKNAVTAEKGTVIFQNPGSGPTSTTGQINYHNDPMTRSIFDGYKLVEGSPAIGKGKKVTDENGKDNNGKELCETDFFGNKISISEIPDIGAHKYQPDEGTLIPQSPQKVEAGEVSEDSVTISWPVVSDPVGIKGYKIMLGDKVFKPVENLAEVTDSETGMISVKITDLEPNKTYTFSVVAYDSENITSKPMEFTFTTAKKQEVTDPPVKDPDEGEDKVSSIALDQTSLTLYTKQITTAVLKAKVSNLTGSINWSSSNPSVASVSNGTVTAKSAGTAVITAEVGEYKASCTVTVKNPTLTVKKKITVKKGKKVKLKVTADPSGKITYKIQNNKKKIAKVTKKGVVKGLKKGKCKLIVTCNGVSQKVTVKVK